MSHHHRRKGPTMGTGKIHLNPVSAIRAYYKEMMNPDPTKKPGPVRRFSKEEIEKLNAELKKEK